MGDSADLALISGVDGGRVTAHRFVLGAASRDTKQFQSYVPEGP